VISYLSDERLPLDVHDLHEFIPGRPKTKGSLRHKGRGHMVESVGGSSQWRSDIASALALRLGQKSTGEGPMRIWRPYAGPVAVGAVFYFDPPRNVREGAPRAPIGRQYGDLDKLARNLGDALTDAGVIADDSQIYQWMLHKEWTDLEGDPEGVSLRVWVPR